MGNAEKRAGKRFFRGIVSLFISGIVAFAADKPYLVGLVPIINATGKWLRDKFGLKYIPF